MQVRTTFLGTARPDGGRRGAPRSRREGLDEGSAGWLRARLGQRVSGASLGIVRIAVGLVGMLSMWRLLAHGWVDSLYGDPARHFTYPGFGWVAPPPGWGMRALVVVVGLAAVAVVLGAWYRAAIAVFWFGFTWIELIDVTTYLNHYWFLTVAGALLLVLPMDAALSVRSRRRGRRTVPLGAVWLLRGQIAVVYVFAGLAKVHHDWLVDALPLRLWLPARADLPLVGPWLALPLTAHVLALAGAVFDLTIVGFLLWRRTRLAAWLVVVAFHIATYVLFPTIGVFPLLMIGVTTVFFRPDWPEVVARLLPLAGARRSSRRPPPSGSSAVSPSRPVLGRLVLAAGVAWMVLQVALPLRAHLIAGDHRWTGEGYRFAWNVLATERAGDVSFRVTDPAAGRTWTETAEDLYTPLQWRAMAADAELIRQAAHAIAARERAGGRQVEVRVDAMVSLNGREPHRLIDPTVDLGAQPWRPGHQPFVLAEGAAAGDA